MTISKIGIEQYTAQKPGKSDVSYMGSAPDYMIMALSQDMPGLPHWWSPYRDVFLRRFLRGSSIVGAINYNRVVGIKNMGWRLVLEDDRLEPLMRHYHDLFEMSQFGDGFRQFLNLYATDHYTQDNGAFIELVGDGELARFDDEVGNPVIAKGYLPKYAVKGFAHLDAAQVWRTNSREFPFMYTNPWTMERTLFHWTRCIGTSQFRQPIERGRGIGICALARAYQALNIIQISNEFIEEKMVGASPELAIAEGVAMEAIRTAVSDNAFEMDARGLARWKGTVFVQADVLPGGKSPSVNLVGLRNTPDGWDREKELTLAMYIVSTAYATDVRDFGWSFGTTGATKADAEIQDLKTSGKGRADVLRDLEDIFNNRIMPTGIRFEFDQKDDLEDMRKAEIQNLRAETRSTQILSGELTSEEARMMAAAEGDIDPAFLEDDTIATDTVDPRDAEAEAPKAEETAAVETAEFEEGEKVSQERGREIYRGQLFRAANTLRRTGEIGDFFISASDIIQKQGKAAYLRGIQDGGNAGIRSVGMLEPNEIAEMTLLVNEQVGFLMKLSDYAGGDVNMSQLKSRIDLWVNKGLDGIYNAGKLTGAKNKTLEWIYGDTEHCSDCLNLNGRVYRASIWKKYEIQPRSSLLECKGFKCQCKFEPTDKPPTKGRPPKISGSKHGH